MAAGEKQLGKYLLKSQLGQGGMGVVYLATDLRLKRDVALKILPRQMASNADAVERFFQEARVVARLNHPNVVVVHDADQERGYCYLVMELLTGGTAQDLLSQGPLSWSDATAVIMQACRGLAAAQEAGLIHRDIKPSNIMCAADGAVKLTDFGLAKITDDVTGANPLTKSNTILGTPQYMSPEQCRGEPLDVRSDVYSLGATYYALLVGQPPYTDTQPLQVMFSHCSKPTPDPRSLRGDIPANCAEIVLRAMAKNRTARYATAREMLTALNQVLASLPTTAITNFARPAADASQAPTIALAASARPNVPSEKTFNRQLSALVSPAQQIWQHRRIAATSAAILLALLFCVMIWRWFGSTQAANIIPTDEPPITLEFAADLTVEAAIRSIAFSPDNKSLFSASLDGSVRQWDVANKKVLRSFAGTQQQVLAIAANQKWLAAGGHAKTVWLWKLDSTQVAATIPDFAGEVSTLAMSPDGKRLAVGTYGEVKLYELNDSGARLIKLLGSSTTQPVTCYMVMSVAFSFDSRWLAATSWSDRKVFVWDAVTGELKGMQQRQTDDPMAAAFIPGQQTLIFGMQGHGLVKWDIGKSTAHALSTSRQTHVRGLAISPGGRTAAVVGGWDTPVNLFDLHSDAPPRLIQKSTSTSAIAVIFSPDGKYLAASGGEEGPRRGYLHLWNVVRSKSE